MAEYTSNGGGATHIAKVTGQLKDLSSNLSDILMVSGGGGGGLLVGDTDYSGKEAGGISGSGDNSADQSTGNAFGLGESGTNVSGGGSGLYGGYKGTSSKSGGAGSGYIGNSLLSNKKMVGYNVPTSSAEGTKTESVNEVSASAVSGKPKSGNGFARIKFLREIGQTIIYENGVCNPTYFEDGQYKTITVVGAGGSHSVTFNGNNIEIQTSSGAYNTQRAVHTVFDGIEIPEEFTKVKIYGHITFGAISPTMGGLNFNIQSVGTNGSYDYIIEHPSVVHTDAYHIGSNGRNSWSGNNISDEYDFVWEGGFDNVVSTYGGRYIGIWTNCLHTCESLNIKITKIVIEP